MNRLAILVAILVLGVLSIGALSARASTRQPGPELQVYLGYGPPTQVVEEFFPRSMRVVEGTTVTWRQETPRNHTVTFLAGGRIPPDSIRQPEGASLPEMRNPLAEYPTLPDGPWDGTSFINSGRMQAGDSFSVTFARAGAYEFVCIPHFLRDGMAATVEVVPPGTAGVTTQEQVDQEVAAEFAALQAQTDEMVATRSPRASIENANGTRTWFVRVGTDWRQEADGRVGRLTLRAFLPGDLSIRQGDSVVWYTDSRVPVHTVTFPVQNAPPLGRWTPRLQDGSLVPIEMLQPNGAYVGDPNSLDWPRIVEDPTISVPSRPSPVYDPTRYFNSPQLRDEPQGRAWSLTFDTPGTFSYLCIPHVDIGMIGSITVGGR